jgi:hypothetical protein
MASYIMVFDSTGQTHEDFTVPREKVVYLTRAPQVSQGTATVRDLNTQNTYVIPDGQTIYLTNIPVGASVSLAFTARSNSLINSVIAEVISQR